MKKSVSFILAILLLLTFALSACNNKTNNNDNSSSDDSTPSVSMGSTYYTEAENFVPTHTTYNYYTQNAKNTLAVSHTTPDYYKNEYAAKICMGNKTLFFGAACENTQLSDVIHIKLENSLTGELIPINTIKLPLEIDFHSVFANMINEREGFVFAFSDLGMSIELSFLYKTEDGWESWEQVDITTTPELYIRDNPIIARFFDENRAIISGRYAAWDMFYRTFITLDGGKTWNHMPELPFPSDIQYSFDTEISNISVVDETFIITLRIYNESRNHTYIQFESSDLISWSLVKETYPSLLFYTETYNNNNTIYFCRDYLGQLYLDVPDWDEYILPSLKTQVPILPISTALFEDKCILVTATGDSNDINSLYLEIFNKNSDISSSHIIELSQNINVTKIHCSFIDDLNGMIFVYYKNSSKYEEPFLLLKTQDGGKTWRLKDIQHSHIDSYNVAFSKFLSDDIGIISYLDNYNDKYDDVRNRTYLTIDGGKTWNLISNLPCNDLSNYDFIGDFRYVNNRYVIVLQDWGGEHKPLSFSSINLKLWTLVK